MSGSTSRRGTAALDRLRRAAAGQRLLALAVAARWWRCSAHEPAQAMRRCWSAAPSAPGWPGATRYATNFIFTGLAVALAGMPGCSTSAARPGLDRRAAGLRRRAGAGPLAAGLGGAAAGHAGDGRGRRGLGGGAGLARPARQPRHHDDHVQLLASALLVWLLVNVLAVPGNPSVEAGRWPGRRPADMQALLAALGVNAPATPLNRRSGCAAVRCPGCGCCCGTAALATSCARSATRRARRTTPACRRCG